jgi:hypothetical protein
VSEDDTLAQMKTGNARSLARANIAVEVQQRCLPSAIVSVAELVADSLSGLARQNLSP